MTRWFCQRLLYWGTRIGMRLAVGLASTIPRDAVYGMADRLARLGFSLFHGFRSRSIRNMTLALGDKFSESEIRRLVQASLTNFFYAFVEIPMSLAAGAHKLRDEISFQGQEYLDTALAKGNGVILLSAHLGNFFLLGTRLAINGYKTYVLINQPRDGRFAQLMDEYRLQVCQATIHARPRHHALRQLVQVLRRNEIAVIIADEYRKGNQGVRVPFFGRAVLARRGPITLALRTGAAVLPAVLIRDAANHLTLMIEPELELTRTERDKTAIIENTLRITQWLERTVRLYPDQWNWMTVNWQDGTDRQAVDKGDRLEQLGQ